MTTASATPPGTGPITRAERDDRRECDACTHALRLRGETWCCVSAGAYACADERAIPPLKAWLLGACGQTGRFFAPRPRSEASRSFDIATALNQELSP